MTTSEVSVEGLRQAEPGDPGESVYRARRGRLYRSAMILILLGAFIGMAPARQAPQWLAGTATPGAGEIFAGVMALLCAGLGLLTVLGTLRGLPRLTVMPGGLRLETVFGSKSASWGSLGPFEVRRVYTGWGRSVATASAAIVGAEVSRNLRRRKKLTLAGNWVAPLEDVVADLNRRRARALGTLADEPEAASGAAADRFGVAGFRQPWLTFAILAVLVAVFVAEQLLALDPPGPLLRPSIKTLLALGGLERAIVLANGEWYRLFIAPLLHADLNHLLCNGIALLLVGYSLERLVGRVWFLAFFAIGGLGGALCSLAINPATLTSVGASGAIMGLFAAALTGSFRLPAGTLERSRIQFRSAQVLVPSLLPLATSVAGGGVDYAAHFGGAVSGAAVALLLLRTWPATARLPRFRRFAAALGAAGVLLVAVGAAEVGSGYPAYRRIADLMPAAALPKTDEEAKSRAASLVARYPADPRAHFYRGFARMAVRDYAEAERELRTALQQAEGLRFYFGRRFENTVRVLLAVVLVDAGRAADAREAARPVCAAPAADRPAEAVAKALADQHLCD